MNQFLKTAFVLFFVTSFMNLFAQDNQNLVQASNENDRRIKPFKFVFGSGIYNLMGDISSEETGFLKGAGGFNAGMKLDLTKNIDVSFLFVKTSFSGINDIEQFNSEVDGFGLHFGYSIKDLFNQSKISPIFSLGVQRLGVSTITNDQKKDRTNIIAIPAGIGLRMNVTKRMQFDVAMNFGLGMGDIDMSNAGNSDGYRSLTFTINYDLFSPSENLLSDVDANYYEDVDFAKLDAEDEDGDLIPDLDDECPETPAGIKVDENGCPLDNDKDGIANYLDQEKNTPAGSLVDENGVQLTEAQSKSMYGADEIASRKYANFYNEVEIKREDYETIDEYLIAKANAFNKFYNESLNNNSVVNPPVYRLKIGQFIEIDRKSTMRKLLSEHDLKSFIMNDGTIIYTVGEYADIDDAKDRKDRLYDTFEESVIIVDDNGTFSEYIAPVPVVIDPEEVVVNPADTIVETSEELDSIVDGVDGDLVPPVLSGTTYRVQIGAFKKLLSPEVFVGVANVIPVTGKDDWVRYMVGSFANYKDAVDYQAQMIARGFSDAFIVTYKDGERISLNIAIKTNNSSNKEKSSNNVNENPSENVTMDLKFIIQIIVSEGPLDSEMLERIAKLGDYEEKNKGSDMYVYYTGAYSTLDLANVDLEKIQTEGFSNAFVFATKDGRRISLKQAERLFFEINNKE